MEHRKEVHSFIAQVKTLVATPEAALLMTIFGVGEGLARCCAAVDTATQFGLTPEERVFIQAEIINWVHRVERGEGCVCGKCHTGEKPAEPEPTINSIPIGGTN